MANTEECSLSQAVRQRNETEQVHRATSVANSNAISLSGNKTEALDRTGTRGNISGNQ